MKKQKYVIPAVMVFEFIPANKYQMKLFMKKLTSAQKILYESTISQNKNNKFVNCYVFNANASEYKPISDIFESKLNDTEAGTNKVDFI